MSSRMMSLSRLRRTPTSTKHSIFSSGITNTGFPREIADRTDINESSVAKTMRRLEENDVVERSDEIYYVDPVRIDTIRARLTSVDAVVRLFEATPDDDAYAEAGWEEQVPTIDSTGVLIPAHSSNQQTARAPPILLVNVLCPLRAGNTSRPPAEL